jgi:hypothetical protein
MHIVDLTQDDVEKLHRTWSLESWREFVQNAPVSWRSEDLMGQMMPIFILIGYGQDMSLDMDDETFRDYFDRGHRWTAYRYVSFALATHIR